MAALATWAPEDGTLGAVAPLALACAAATALVIDLDSNGPRYPGRTLAEVVEDGPTRDELHPHQRGVAVLPNGGIDPDDASEVIEALMQTWPDVVLRLPAVRRHQLGVPTVPILPLSPLVARVAGPAVYQRSLWRMDPPGPGIVLPRPAAVTIRALARGSLPGPSRWIRRWAEVWELPWD
jgi:hypothetical protein